MTKNEWIKLINAIRLRKKEYSGQDGEITYRFTYRKTSLSRQYLKEDGKDEGVQLKADECILLISNKRYQFYLTCFYGHEIFFDRIKNENYSIDFIKKNHPREVFVDHIKTGASTDISGSFPNFPTNAEDFLFQSGFYAAAFLYAFDVKDPYLQLFYGEWIVVDSKAGDFDFGTYFNYPQVIPIKLPIPKFIDVKQVPILKLANGVEIKDPIDPPIETTNTDDAGEYLNEIRRSIEENPIV